MSNPDPWQLSGPADANLEADNVSAAKPTSPLVNDVIRVLRKRWKVALLLAAIAAPAAAVAGWKLGKVEYTSFASLHVKPVLPRIIYKTDDQMLPMYDQYVATQVELIKNRRTIDLAVQDPRWVRAYGPATAEAVVDFMGHVTVLRNGQIIIIGIVDEQPATAQAGATALVSAYRRLFIEQDSLTDEETLTKLQTRKTSLTNEQNGIRQQISTIANTFGTEDLAPLYAAKLTVVNEIESQLMKLRMGDRSPTTAPSAETSDLQIAMRADPGVRALVQKREDKVREERALAGRVGPIHRELQDLRSELTNLSREISDRVAEMKAAGDLDKPEVSANPAIGQKQLEDMLAATRAELLELGRQSLAIENLKREEGRLRDEVQQTNRRIDEINTEASNAGRLKILSEGDMPIIPTKDSRIRNAGVGGFGAALLMVAGVVGWGLLDKRVRGLEDVSSGGSSGPMLGVLPEIPEGLENPELALQAAHNVHHIRTMLEVWANGRTPLSLTVTSPSSGSGKTSLTLSLGVSFAAAGLKVLMIDLDLVGGGLTSRAHAMTRRRLGGLLVAAGVINDVQRVEALKLSADAGIRLGEACIQLGYATADQIAEAVREQDETEIRGGIMEGLMGAPLSECVSPTEVPSLSVMTVGQAEIEQAAAVSPHMVRRLIARAGEVFDVILVDTGPAPGSLEAGAAAASTNGVILAVARGEDRAAVRACSAYLAQTGATLAGLVFNRANMSDVRSLSTSRTSSAAYRSSPRSSPRLMIPGSSLEAQPEQPTNMTSGRIGPIAGAVAKSLRTVPGKPSNQ